MKAVIYIRVSTEEQVKNLSLETQKNECVRYCARNALAVDRIFTEEGDSAKTTNRPELQAMLAYCRANKGKVGTVVVYNMSRFARNAYDHHAVRHLLSKCGVRLRSVCEPIEDSTTGKFFESVLAAVAQLDNDMRSDRSRAGMKTAVEKGRWPFPATIGYKNARTAKDEPTLEHDPVRAPLIRQGFELYATGHFTKRQVLNRIMALGFRSLYGKKVTLSTFVRILANPIYAGRVEVAKWGQKVKGNFPPIVSQALFDKVQLVAQGRRTNTPATHLRENPHFPLRGSIRCGCCDSLLTAYFAKGRSKHYGYYACYNVKCGTKTKAKKDALEADFDAYLQRLQAKPDLMRVIREVVLAQWNRKRDSVVLGAATHQAAVDEIEQKLTRLEEAYMFERVIDKVRYDLHRAKLEEQLVAARVALHDCQVEELDIEVALNFAEYVMTNAASLYAQLSIEQKRRFLAVLSPTGWVVDPKKGFRTAATCPVFNVFEQNSKHKLQVVGLVGFEPTTKGL